MLLSQDLTDAQIAQIVGDVSSLADIPKNNEVGVTEYVQFMTQHETGLHLLVSKYGDQEGDLLRANAYQAELIERGNLKQGVSDSQSGEPVTITDEIQQQSTSGGGGPNI